MRRIMSTIADRSSDFYCGRASISGFVHIPAMTDDRWRERLRSALEASGKSQREVSLAAGMSGGYFNSVMKQDKEPTISRLLALCDAIGVSLSYIAYGIEFSAEDEELLRVFALLPPGQRRAFLALVRSTAGLAPEA